VSYLLLLVLIAVLVYAGLRMARAYNNRPKTRVRGPDDDPDFLFRLGRDDDTPQR
jgi:hypothetical protein